MNQIPNNLLQSLTQNISDWPQGILGVEESPSRLLDNYEEISECSLFKHRENLPWEEQTNVFNVMN